MIIDQIMRLTPEEIILFLAAWFFSGVIIYKILNHFFPTPKQELKTDE